GVSGVLFQQLALVVAFSLAVSLLVALTAVPMLASKVLREDRQIGGSARPLRALADLAAAAFSGMERVYLGVLRDALRARLLTVALAVALLGGSFWLAQYVGTEFLPPSDEGEVRVTGEMEVGTRLELVDRQTRIMESIVFPAVPEMESAVVSVGA